ncbi:MAG TPA: bifunctional polysaccharide deacetylase/glycosyltransferase family 2 protein [Candidatus Limnocylindrales bacterium]
MRRDPRAHWILLLLVSAVTLGGPCLNGYVNHVGGEGIGPAPARREVVPAPKEVNEGGPVQRIDATGKVSTTSLPAKTIALTFDDGPDPQWTPKVMAVLAKHQAHATFFAVGSKVNQHPDIVRDLVSAGHEVGAHTFTHIELGVTPSWKRGIETTLSGNAIAAATGRVPILMRPPYSSRPNWVTQAEYAAMKQEGAAGYLVVLTDLDSEDWRGTPPAEMVKLATPKDGAGAVVMFHDSGGDRSQTVAALDILIPQLKAQGYRFTTVSEALDLPAAPRAGFAQRLRGEALRWAQVGGGWLAGAMTFLMAIAVGLTGIRLALQMTTAHVHRRRVRRLKQRPKQFLGPVSVIVPAFNERANIAATVRSLVDSDYPQLEVIVVDDGSTDGTAEIVERLRLPGVHVIRQENAGKPAALNHGISYARGDLLVLVDGDTVFEPGALGALVQPFQDPSVGAVSGNTKVANRRGLLGRWQHLEYVIGFNLDRRMYDVLQCMPTVPGAIGAFRREAVIDVGGVPGETLAEDTDFTMAIARAGWRIAYAPDAVAWTEAPATLRQLWRQRYRWCYGTMQSMWKHRRAVFERGASGRLGRRGISYLWLFQVLLPLSAPMVDIYGIYGAIFLPPVQVATVWVGFTLVQVFTAAYALRMDREKLRPLWTLPLQMIVYRQLMYLVVIQSTVMALIGGRLRWQRMTRTGAVARYAAR